MATSRTTTAALPTGALHPIARPRLYGIKGRPDPVSVGTVIWLASDLMFFAALFAAFFTIRNVTNGMPFADGTTLFSHGHGMLNVTFASINTVILVISSATCQMGVRAAEHMQVARTGSLFNAKRWGMREWYTLTFVLGAIFIGGQIYEYFALYHEGLTISSDAFGSLFFLATGFHGMHVTGGLIAFLFLMGRTYLARTFTREQMVNAVVVSYYWHFVDVIWVILYSVIYLLPLTPGS